MKITISVRSKFWAFELAKQLLKRNYLKKLITTYPKFLVVKENIPKKYIDSMGYLELINQSWIRMPGFIKKLYNLNSFLSKLFDSIVSKKINKSDIFIGWSNSSLNSLKKAKKSGIVAIVECGSTHPQFSNKIMSEEYKKFGLEYQINKQDKEKMLKEFEIADYITIPSKFVEKTFIENGISKEKLIRVPYGVDLNNFEQIKKDDDIFRVIFVGGLSLRKGTHYILKVFSELNIPNSELLLIGPIYEPEIKPFLKKYKDCYKWIGPKPHLELYKYLSQGSVFVMPSIEEGLAMVQPQAMACGLPLICTTNTGGEDLIRNGKEGFVIPIKDTEALKEKILYMYNNQEKCRKMGQAAKKRVSENFTWDDYGNKIIKKYEEILIK